MINPTGIIVTIYHGVPRFLGELFRATKTPSILLLVGNIGVPFILSVAITTYAVVTHKIAADPGVDAQFSSDMVKLMSSLTPEQKQTGKTVVEFFTALRSLGAIYFPRKTARSLPNRRHVTPLGERLATKYSRQLS